MAKTTRGSGIRTDVSSRSRATFVPAAKYNKSNNGDRPFVCNIISHLMM